MALYGLFYFLIIALRIRVSLPKPPTLSNTFSAPLHLTEQQQSVVHHSNDHARVMAVAGAGKT